MTNDLSEVREVSQEQEKATITLEPMDHGGITLHWEDLITAIKVSVPNCDMQTVAHAMVSIRAKRLLAWAIWVGEKIQGFVLTQPANMGFDGQPVMFIIALYGHDLTLEQWQDAITQFADIVRPLGYKRLVALTKNERVLEIVSAGGWSVSNFCEKDI